MQWGKLLTAVCLCTILFATNVVPTLTGKGNSMSKVTASQIGNSDFLKTDGKVLKNNYGSGDVVYLRGTNAGGYLLQEFWMCLTEDSSNVHCEMDIYNTLTNRFGDDKMRELVNFYQDQYWTTQDFDNCKDMGINCIRLPIWYLNLEDKNGNDLKEGWDRIDWFVREAGARGIYVVLDFHGAPGSQNGSDHSGVDGGNNKKGASEFFWGNNASSNQERYYRIWEKLARRYKDNPAVAGYDLLNEPYCTYRYNSGLSDSELRNLLWGIYDNAYKRIRAIDSNHVIIMEATWDAVDLPNPSSYGWQNVMYEYHNYLYDDYDNNAGNQITNMQRKIDGINAANYNVPSYMGEFCYFNNIDAWKQGVELLNNAGLNWTTWTYKTVSSYGNWGLYHHTSGNKVNVETDSFDQIKNKWANVKTSERNDALVEALKPYFTANNSSNNQSGSNDEVLKAGQYYFTADANGKVVCAEDEGKSPVAAVRDSFGGAWEVINVEKNSDGTYSFRSGANNKYICAVIDEENQLTARSEKVQGWEKFKIIKVSNDQYAFKSIANDKYVKADITDNGKCVLKADSDSIQLWECFHVNFIK